jgi:hypothetical protein
LPPAASATPAREPDQPRRTPAGAATEPSNRFEGRRADFGLTPLLRRAPTTLQLDLHGSRMQRPTIERILVLLAASKSVRTVEILGGDEVDGGDTLSSLHQGNSDMQRGSRLSRPALLVAQHHDVR